MEEEKHAGGRPPKYKDEYCKQAFVACSEGNFIDDQLAMLFDVKTSTINNWKKEHPKFLESIKAGKEAADAKVEQSLFKKATGFTCKDTKFATHEGTITDSQEYDKHFPPDSTAAIFWLKNRRPELWRDKQEIQHSGAVRTESVVEFADLPEVGE